MKKLIAAIMCSALFFTGCQGGGGASSAGKPMEYKELYGVESETLNYLNATTLVQMTILGNVMDALVEHDKYGVVKPALATDWSVSPDGLVWTFNLRKGVKWMKHDGTEYGEEVKANDFVEGVKWQVTTDNASKNEFLFDGMVKNAAKFFKKEITDFSQVGIKAKSDYVLEFTLEKPTPYFITMLTYSAFFPVNGKFIAEQGAAFGTDNTKVLYNGAYILQTFSPQAQQVFVKNQGYWDKDNVFITKITKTFNKESLTLSPEMFFRKEVHEAIISSDLLAAWMKDPEKSKSIRPSQNEYYTYFYALNFDPKFDAKYEPANWKVVVNNESFRKALYHGMDRKAAMLTEEPYAPETRLNNTLTPVNFAESKGKDYTQFGDLAKIAAADSFDAAKAKEFKDKAMTELKGKATFPVKTLMPYNPNTANWAKRAQVIEQQVENLLGKDFIDIIVEAGPATGFLGEVRRPGKYAILECNWGPDYTDPETYTEPFSDKNTYNKIDLAEGYQDPDGKKTYSNLVAAAKAITNDNTARYEAFAKAEAFLIDKAFIIPYAVSNPGYKASYLNPFERQYSPAGVSNVRYKGLKILEKPMSTEEFKAAQKTWLEEKAKAQAAAK